MRNTIVADVEIEEILTPLDAVCFWHANGGTVIVRQKEDIWAGICKMDGWTTRLPYRLQLWRRDNDGWRVEQTAHGLIGHPHLGTLHEGKVFANIYTLRDPAELYRWARETGDTYLYKVAFPMDWTAVPVTTVKLPFHEATHWSQFQAGWDEENLYVKVKVADPFPAENECKAADRLWLGDALELNISANPPHSTWVASDYKILIAASEKGDIRACLRDELKETWVAAPEMESQTKIWADRKGYYLEAKIPLRLVGLMGMEAGKAFLFDWNIIYQDSDRNLLFRNPARPNGMKFGRPAVCGIGIPVLRPEDQGTQETQWFKSVEELPAACPPDQYQPGAIAVNAQVLEFDAKDPGAGYKIHRPVWFDGSLVSDHHYSGFAVDGKTGEMLAFHVEDASHDDLAQAVSYRDRKGTWHERGMIWHPIRCCHPTAAIENSAAHVVTHGGVIEPVKDLYELGKKELGRENLYSFRRLFYFYSPDISSEHFSEAVEIDPNDDGEYIHQFDVMIDRSGKCHVVYLKRRFRFLFYQRLRPGVKNVRQLVHVVLKGGKEIAMNILWESEEKTPAPERGFAWDPPEDSTQLAFGMPRIHQTPEGRLFIFTFGRWTDERGIQQKDNFLIEFNDHGRISDPVALNMKYPLVHFRTSTPRAGAELSRHIDVAGLTEPTASVMRYAKITFKETS